MFGNFDKFVAEDGALTVDQNGEASNLDLAVAVAAILIDIGRSDSAFESSEMQRILSLLEVEFQLSGAEAGQAYEVAEFLQRTSSDKLEQLFAAIKTGFDVNQRVRVLGMAWKVLLADREIVASETQGTAHLRQQLGLSLEQALLAQRIAAEEHSLSEVRAADIEKARKKFEMPS